jgi:DNA-binding NarL/FixJ family response regulator
MMANVLSRTKILIVDDHSMVREGLRLRISAFSDLEVCGEATTEDEAVDLVKTTNPNLVIVDISLKSGHGLELIKRIKAIAPNIKMLVSTGFQESLYAERAMRAGAMGYLNKQDSGEKVIEAIRTLLRGERYVSAAITQRLVSQALGNQSQSCDPIDLLTDRELEIFRMIGSGKTSGAIADELFLSSHTIDTHRENIKRKLGLKNAAELSRQAVQFLLENS